jgi:hypothetical protein
MTERSRRTATSPRQPLSCKPVGGLPTLMAGAHPLPAPIFCLMGDQAQRDEVVTALYRNGVNAFATRNPIAVGHGPSTQASLDRLLKHFAHVARLAPRAWLMADCGFGPAPAWLTSHPHEGYLSADNRILYLPDGPGSSSGRMTPVPGPTPRETKADTWQGVPVAQLYGCRRVSPFSMAFAEAAAADVGRLLDRIAQAGLATQLAGVFIGCYVYGEWNLGIQAPDHSRAALTYFRGFLKRKYGTVAALRRAWADDAVNFVTARPPRDYSSIDLPPVKIATARLFDYRTAEAEALAEQFATIAHAVKRHAPRLVVGGFFPGCSSPQSDWRRLAQRADIDFVATPLAYENRGPGGGVSSQSPFCESLSPLGKVFFDEIDTRTLRADRATNGRYGRARTIAESVGLLWRDAGQMLIRGHHGWWLDFGNNRKPPYSWHLDPEFLAFHKRFGEIWQSLADLDRRPCAEVRCFIPSSAARDYQILYPADYQRHTEWMLAGLPVAFDSLENLLEGRTPPGRFSIIYGAATLTEAQTDALARRLSGHGGTVLWMGGAGLCAPGRVPDDARLDGLMPMHHRLAGFSRAIEPEASLTAEGRQWLGLNQADRPIGQYHRAFTSGFSFISEKLGVPMPRIAVNGLLTVTDPEAAPLARLDAARTFSNWEQEVVEQASMAIVKHDADQSVVMAMKVTEDGTTHIAYHLPVLESGLLRALAARAGCHCFTTRDDVVYASRGLLLLHATYTGEHTLRFPRPASRVHDLIRDRPVTLRGGNLRLTLQRGDTRLYRFTRPAAPR